MTRAFLLIFPALLLTACGAPSPEHPVITPETVRTEPAPPAPPPKPKISGTQLLGQNGAWVTAKLGTPTFVRTEKTANIWQYKNGICVLNLFLYVEQDTAPRVLHFDARDAEGRNTDRETCLTSLQD